MKTCTVRLETDGTTHVGFRHESKMFSRHLNLDLRGKNDGFFEPNDEMENKAMIGLRRAQKILGLFTLLMLGVLLFSTFKISSSPSKYIDALEASNASTVSITLASRDALGLVEMAGRWARGNVPKSEVQIAQAELTKRLETFNYLSGQPISSLLKLSSLQALRNTAAVIQESPKGILPIQLQAKTQVALDQSLNGISILAGELIISFEEDLTNQLRAAISVRQKSLTQNLQVTLLFLLMALTLIVWVGATFSRQYKSIQSSIKVQLDGLAVSREEGEFIFANLAKFAGMLQGQRDLMSVAKTVLSELAPLVNAQYGVFYIMNKSVGKEAQLHMLSSYAYKEQRNSSKEWKLGEGLVGQCAVEKKSILLTDVPANYIHIASGLGEAKPFNIMVMPMIFEGEVKAVFELASFTPWTPMKQAFMSQLAESIGTVINTIEISMRTEELLKKSQSLTDELQSQQEELRETNQELEEKTQILEEQKMEVETKKREVEQAKSAVEEKAIQLELTSKYKSEFLSNMSHELRTPLNSLLILAQQLSDNSQNHLDSKEVEFAKLIEVSGNDLLLLINEILDLSKIESGTVSLNLSAIPFAEVHDQIESTFHHISKNQKLNFEVSFARDLPAFIVTDEMRLLQVLKNLLANSFKFTENGTVSLHVDRATSGWSLDHKNLNRADQVFSFTVRDTGIGISDDKKRIIFEAFQQGDGRTARKYGGTGLGLSISREIAHLLGGELKLAHSVLQQGSQFILYVPQNNLIEAPVAVSANEQTIPTLKRTNPISIANVSKLNTSNRALRSLNEVGITDDREEIVDGDRVLLIIEDDVAFANILLDLAREKGFKGIVALRGAQGLELARSHKPDAITLDIHIPDIDGWTILDLLKRDLDLRHIPVDVITVEDTPMRARSQGAFQYLTKPVDRDQLAHAMELTYAFLDRPVKNLLIVTANKDEEKEIIEMLGDGEVAIQHAAGGNEAMIAMSTEAIDCVVIGTKFSNMSFIEFLTAIGKEKFLAKIPVVVFSGAAISGVERNALEKLATSSVVKTADSPERLLDQTALFLHRVVSRLPEEKRKLLQQLHYATNILGGKRVLIADDDARNIFALTVALERKGVLVTPAETGFAALEILKGAEKFDLVLMDIMMPEMDGYETMRAIRKIEKFKDLPIIALTAKAMVGDREKCLEAGASDYLSKPVNIEQLASVMSVWLSN